MRSRTKAAIAPTRPTHNTINSAVTSGDIVAPMIADAKRPTPPNKRPGALLQTYHPREVRAFARVRESLLRLAPSIIAVHELERADPERHGRGDACQAGTAPLRAAHDEVGDQEQGDRKARPARRQRGRAGAQHHGQAATR